jgi:hypothetical protein
MLKKVLILIIFTTAPVFSQDEMSKLDSLYNSFLEMKGISSYSEIPQRDSINEEKKCGFRVASEIYLNIDKFDLPRKENVLTLLQRPVTQTSIVSDSGLFRVHFDTSGIHKVYYNVYDFAKALDSSYNYEVNYLGYPAPAATIYDVYIQNTGGYYGYTQPEGEIVAGSKQYYSYIVVHNSFAGFYTQGIDAARVTAAHELHHAIQMSNYILREENENLQDVFFYEMTSTAMEEFVFDTVNDYYGYMKSYFDNPDRTFSLNNGYNIAAWNIFLKDRHGFDVLKRQWAYLINYRALLSIELSLNDYNTSFAEELSEFGVWTYFTNYRSIPNKYFTEAEFYPVIRPMNNVAFYPPSKTVSVNSSPVSNCFIRFFAPFNNQVDTLFAIISNGDVQRGIQSPASSIPFIYDLYNYNAPGSESLDGYYYAKLYSSDLLFFIRKEILNDSVMSGNGSYRRVADFVFPSPFRYKKHEFLYLPVPPASSGLAEFFIYDLNMELLFSNVETIINKFGNRVVKWNGLKQNNDKTGSGIYFYLVKSNSGTINGKLVIVNE